MRGDRRQRPRPRTPRAPGPAAGRPPESPPPPTTMQLGSNTFASPLNPTPSQRPIRSTASIAAESPSWASSVTSAPVISRPRATSRPSPDSGQRAAASTPACASAVPDAIASRQPWFRAVARTGRPVRLHDDVAQLARGTVRAAHDRAVDQDRPADPRAQRHHQRVADPVRRARSDAPPGSAALASLSTATRSPSRSDRTSRHGHALEVEVVRPQRRAGRRVHQRRDPEPGRRDLIAVGRGRAPRARPPRRSARRSRLPSRAERRRGDGRPGRGRRPPPAAWSPRGRPRSRTRRAWRRTVPCCEMAIGAGGPEGRKGAAVHALSRPAPVAAGRAAARATAPLRRCATTPPGAADAARKPVTFGRALRWLAGAIAAWLVLSLVLFLVKRAGRAVQDDQRRARAARRRLPADQEEHDPRARLRRPPARHPRGRRRDDRRAQPQRLDPADPHRRRRQRAPLDPARHGGRRPGPRRGEDQRGLRAGRAALAVKTGRAVPGDRNRPPRRGQLRQLPPADRRRSAASTTPAAAWCRRSTAASRTGGFTLRLSPGTHHLDGKQALALARTPRERVQPRRERP